MRGRSLTLRLPPFPAYLPSFPTRPARGTSCLPRLTTYPAPPQTGDAQLGSRGGRSSAAAERRRAPENLERGPRLLRQRERVISESQPRCRCAAFRGSHLRAARHRYACRNSWHIRISVRHTSGCLSAARARSGTRQACRLGSHRCTMKRHGHGVQPFMAQPALWSIAACARTTLGPPACARASPWPIRMRSTMRWVAADPRSAYPDPRARDAPSAASLSAPEPEMRLRTACSPRHSEKSRHA